MKKLICTRCETAGHLCLFEGGVCKDCQGKKPLRPRKRGNQPGRKFSTRQLPETVELQQACALQMDRLQLPVYRFARLLNLVPSGFARWYNKQFTTRGQSKYNVKLRQALEQHAGTEISEGGLLK